MTDDLREELIATTQHLLDAIAAGDWQKYVEACDPSLTCFEPEAGEHMVQGMEFHRYYFELDQGDTPVRTTISSPHVRLLADEAAVVSYVRLIQCLDDEGEPQTLSFAETRVWQRNNGHWRNVHFHRS